MLNDFGEKASEWTHESPAGCDKAFLSLTDQTTSNVIERVTWDEVTGKHKTFRHVRDNREIKQ